MATEYIVTVKVSLVLYVYYLLVNLITLFNLKGNTSFFST